jgi:hypothetical protein
MTAERYHAAGVGIGQCECWVWDLSSHSCQIASSGSIVAARRAGSQHMDVRPFLTTLPGDHK